MKESNANADDRTSGITRRGLLLGSITGSVLLALNGLVQQGSSAYALTDFEVVRGRWSDYLVGRPVATADPDVLAAIAVNDAKVADHLLLWSPSSTARTIFSDYPMGTDPRNMRKSLERLLDLAVAYSTPGSSYVGQAHIRDKVREGTLLINTLEYYPRPADGNPPYGNWWEWEIGSGIALTSLLMVVFDEFTAAERTNLIAAIRFFNPSPRRTAANLVNTCQILIACGVLESSISAVTTATTAMGAALKYVTTGDGFYWDGSFVQHVNVAYTGSYGLELILGIAQQMSLLTGTTLQLPASQQSFMFTVLETAFFPAITNGVVLDTLRGRQIASQDFSDRERGMVMLEQFVLLASASSGPTRQSILGRVKKMLIKQGANIYEGAPVRRVTMYKSLLNDTSVAEVSEKQGGKVFAQMGRAVYRNANWTFVCALSSKRIAHMESLTLANRKAFHTGSGMTYFYPATDIDHYTDQYWSSVDWYRLPGTTLSKKQLTQAYIDSFHQGRPVPTNAYAGGTYGYDKLTMAVGMHLEGPDSTLRAKKSWFVIGNAIVHLGADISCSDAEGVESIVEHRNVRSSSASVRVDGAATSVAAGPLLGLSNGANVSIDGVGGYVFMQGASKVRGLDESRTVDWVDINPASAPTAPAEYRRYLSLWFDHGVAPSSDLYGYVFLPSMNAAQTQTWAASPTVRVIANSSQMQVAESVDGSHLLCSFHRSGSVVGTSSSVQSSGPSSVIVNKVGGTYTVHIAEPTQEADALRITMLGVVPDSFTASNEVTVTQIGADAVLSVDTSLRNGAMHTVTLIT